MTCKEIIKQYLDDKQMKQNKVFLHTLYTVRRGRKDGTLFGDLHGSETANDTLCGLDISTNWSIITNTFDGKITCKKCLAILKAKNSNFNFGWKKPKEEGK